MAPLQLCGRGGPALGGGLPVPSHPPALPWHPAPAALAITACLAPPCVQACERNPKLKDIIHRTKVTPDYLWRKAKERDPKLAFKGITIKPTYTEEEKD